MHKEYIDKTKDEFNTNANQNIILASISKKKTCQRIISKLCVYIYNLSFYIVFLYDIRIYFI